MIKIHILLLLMFYLSLAFGQKANDKVSIFVAPLPLIDTYSGSSYRIGTEIKLHEKLSSVIEIGSYFNNSFGMNNINGYLTKIELKAYSREYVYGEKNYISLETLYKQQSYDQTDTISIANKDSYLKEYSISKKIYSFSLKYGAISVSRSGFYIDHFIGLGIRVKNVNCTLTDEEFNNKDYGDQDQIGRSIANSCGNKITPNLILGFRLGWFLN